MRAALANREPNTRTGHHCPWEAGPGHQRVRKQADQATEQLRAVSLEDGEERLLNQCHSDSAAMSSERGHAGSSWLSRGAASRRSRLRQAASGRFLPVGTCRDRQKRTVSTDYVSGSIQWWSGLVIYLDRLDQFRPMVAYVPYHLTHTEPLKFLGRPWCSSICSAQWLVVVGAIHSPSRT